MTTPAQPDTSRTQFDVLNLEQLNELLGTLDPEKVIAQLRDLDDQAKALRTLLRAVRARRRGRANRNGGPTHAA